MSLLSTKTKDESHLIVITTSILVLIFMHAMCRKRMRKWFRDMEKWKALKNIDYRFGVESCPGERAFSGRQGKKGVAPLA